MSAGNGARREGVIGHTVDGHMGRKSMLLLHSGCITPLTHRQTHAAFALVALRDAPNSAAHNNNFRMLPSPIFFSYRALSDRGRLGLSPSQALVAFQTTLALADA